MIRLCAEVLGLFLVALIVICLVGIFVMRLPGWFY